MAMFIVSVSNYNNGSKRFPGIVNGDVAGVCESGNAVKNPGLFINDNSK